MLQRLALYATLGLVLDALGHSVISTGFWCIVALFWASEHVTRMEVWDTIEQELERLRRRHSPNIDKDKNND